MPLQAPKIVNVPINKINLDTENPRFQTSSDNQDDLIAELVRNHKVLDITKKISQFGFFPSEILILIPDQNQDGKYIVIEGNRRVSASKLILNPSKAPDQNTRKFIEQLHTSDEIKWRLKKVKCIVYPTREDTVTYVANKHVAPPIEKWSAINKARYFGKQITSLKEVDEFSKKTGMESAKILEDVRTFRIIKYIGDLEISDQSLAELVDTQAYPMTTIMRFLNYNVGKRFLGIKIDQNNFNFEFSDCTPDAIIKLLSDLTLDKATVNSRTLNDETLIIEYCEENKQYSCDEDANYENFSTEQNQKTTEKVVATSTNKPPSTRKKRTLLPDEWKKYCQSNNIDPKLGKLLGESVRIRRESFPHTSMILLRSLLESSLFQFLNKNGNIDEAKYKGVTTLGSLMKFFTNTKNGKSHLKNRKSLIQTLNNALSQKNQAFSLENLNGATHCDGSVITVQTINDASDHYRPILKFILDDLIQD